MAALLLIALVSSGGTLVVAHLLQQSTDDSRLLNLAGRQRMLAHSLAADLLLLAHADASAERARYEQRVRGALAALRGAQAELTHRGRAKGAANAPAHEVLGDLRALAARLEALESRATALLQREPDASTPLHDLPGLQRVVTDARQFAAEMDATVAVLEAAMRERTRALLHLQLTATGTVLVLLLVVGACVLRPLLRRVRWAYSDLARANRELRDSQTSLALAQRIARLGHWEHDLVNDVLTWSEEIHHIFGIAPDDFAGTYQAFLDRVHPEDREAVREAGRKARETGRPYSLDHRIVRPDGAVRVVNEQGQVFRDSTGRPVRMLGVASDITARREAEEALQSSRRLLRTVFDLLPQAVFVKDTDGRYVLANEAAARLFGLDPEGLQGRSIDALPVHDPAQRSRIRADDREVLRQGHRVERAERPFHLADGSQVLLHVVKLPLRDGTGRIEGLVGIAEDITERKHAETALRESEQRVRLLLNSTAEAILGIDPTGRITFVNPASLRLLGHERPEGLLERNIHDVMHHRRPDGTPYPPAECPLLDAAAAGRRAHLDDERLWRADGSPVRAELWTHPMHRGEDLVGAVVTFMDITDRMHSEEERWRLAAAVEQAANNIFITDTNGDILYVNSSFERTTGYTRNEVKGRKPSMLKSGTLPEDYYRAMWDTITRGETWLGRYSNRRKDGSLYEVEASTFPLRNPAGEITNYISVQRDITQELQLEAQLRQAQRMEAIGTLAGGIAHDFNNLLVPIIGYTGLALQMPDSAQGPDGFLRHVLEAANRARDLVGQILVFSRRTESARRSLHPAPIVGEVTRLLRSTLPKTVTLREEIVADADAVEADPTQLHQVLVNLCVNAGQAMRDGGELLVACDTVELTDLQVFGGQRISGRFTRLRVADTGVGIDEETLPHIFEPFFTTKEVGSGTGLGLATVWGIVEQHGGHLDVVSAPGQGTRFDIYLPATAAPAEPAPSHPSAAAGGRETILFVDDEEAICELGRRVLEGLGYRVHAHTSPMEALQAFEQTPDAFDLVILDQMMPNLTGDELAGRIRRLRPDIPVLLCSGYGRNLTAERTRDLGISEFVQKPFNSEELAAVVRRVLDAPRTAAPSRGRIAAP